MTLEKCHFPPQFSRNFFCGLPTQGRGDAEGTMGAGGQRVIDPQEVPGTFPYKFYAGMFDKHNIPTIPSDQFASFSKDPHKNPPIFIVQTQGYLPKVLFDGNSGGLSPFERGWVQSDIDTGGQTYYVLDQSMALAKLGRRVIILGQRFGNFPEYLPWYKNRTSGGAVEIIRIPAGGIKQGPDGRETTKTYPFIRKEDLYPHLHDMSVDATAIAMLRGAYAFIGGYADGGVIAVAAAHALGRPSAFIAHSMGLRKLELLGYDQRDPLSYYEPSMWFGPRLQAERAAFLDSSVVVPNSPEEEEAFGTTYGIDVPNHRLLTPGINRLFFHDNRIGMNAEMWTARNLMKKNQLEEGRFFISWGRITPSKNLPGQVRILGELRRIYPGEYDDVKLVIIGGNPESPKAEEVEEMRKISAVAEAYGLEVGYSGDIVRIGDLQHGVIAFLAGEALAYLGTQTHEPFGMVPAEMLSIGGSGFVAVSKVAGFAKWLSNQKGYEDVALTIDLGQMSRSGQIDLSKYQAAARAIHDFQNDPLLRDRIRRGAELADTSFRWKAQAKNMLELIRAAAENNQPRPSLHLAMPAWYDPPLAGAHNPNLVNIAKEIGTKIAIWLQGLEDTTRKLITVAGEKAALLADLIAAAIDSPDSRVQRVAGQVWGEGTSEQVTTAVSARPINPETFAPFGGSVFVEEGVKAVVTDIPTPGTIIGDFNIVSGGTNMCTSAHIIITGGMWMASTSTPLPFALSPPNMSVIP